MRGLQELAEREMRREFILRLITAIGIAVISGAIGVVIGGWVL